MTNKLDKIIDKVSNMYPYKQKGNFDTYNRYNEGWSDACDILSEEIKQAFCFDKYNDNTIIEINTNIQLQYRKWWQLWNKGWHKHQDLWGRKWWIRYNWNK